MILPTGVLPWRKVGWWFAVVNLIACGGGSSGGTGTPATVEGPLSGAVTGMVTNGTVELLEPANVSLANGSNDPYLAFDFKAGTSLSVKAPAGVSEASFDGFIFFPSAPAGGAFTQTSAGICAELTLTLTSAARYVMQTAANCNTGATQTPQGSFSLDLTSVTTAPAASDNEADNESFVHGNITVILPPASDASGPSGADVTMALTF